MDITIRRLTTHAEYLAAEQLMQDCWQSGPIEVVPSHLLLTIQSEAGVVLGAFTAEDQLIGFVFGILSREGDQLKHHSHMAGVHPDYRDRNIAYRLKLAQREYILNQGLTLCTWTYDPLESRNAMLNIAKLGAIARTYKRNVYGQTLGILNELLPTDRFVARWELTSDRVIHCARTGQRVAAPVADQLLTTVDMRGALPLLAAIAEPDGRPTVGIQIPTQIQLLKTQQPDAAIAWRNDTRTLFELAFANGYTVVNISPDPQHPRDLAVYTLIDEETYRATSSVSAPHQ